MQDKRKSVRRVFEGPAWIVTADGAAPIVCTFRDMSKTGARLAVPAQAAIPESFVLHLANNGAVARKCVLVWRSETTGEIGVEFVARKVSGPVVRTPDEVQV
jgi:hypothetical protein